MSHGRDSESPTVTGVATPTPAWLSPGTKVTPSPEMSDPATPATPASGADAAQPSPDDTHDTPRLPDYDITGRLGEGGMGVVWKAVQRSTRRAVALKLLGPSSFGSERARQRFEREVELAARLEHPNIARVYDSGIHRGVHYYAMELVEGVHLDAYVKEHQLDKRATLALMRTVCDAVQHAHQRGVIHRDLKPSNILVTNDDQPSIVDFGLAKQALDADTRDANPLTLDGQVAGTPAYMSPEQAAGRAEKIDTRTDIYSLGVILYRLLTGQPPHDLTGSSFTILKRIAETEVRRPRAVSPDASRIIDRELESLLLKALAKDPKDRYASAAAFAQDIDNYLNGEPITAKRATTAYFLRKRMWKHRIPISVAAALVAAGLASTGYAKFRPGRYALESFPSGASILVNGKVKSGCTMTPCFVDLPIGQHEIRLSMPGYRDAIRIVDVDWGQTRILTSSYNTEAVTLEPTFRYVEFNFQPAGATIDVRETETGADIAQGVAPFTVRLPAGKYRFTVTSEGNRLTEQSLEIVGSVEPLRLSEDFR